MFKCPVHVNIQNICKTFSLRFMMVSVARKIGNLFSKDALFNISINISELILVNISVSGYCLFILGHFCCLLSLNMYGVNTLISETLVIAYSKS